MVLGLLTNKTLILYMFLPMKLKSNKLCCIKLSFQLLSRIVETFLNVIKVSMLNAQSEDSSTLHHMSLLVVWSLALLLVIGIVGNGHELYITLHISLVAFCGTMYHTSIIFL